MSTLVKFLPCSKLKSMKSLNVALVGATGMVGRTMLKVLEQRKFPVAKLVPVASEKSIGITIDFNGDSVEVVGIETALEMDLDLALFSAGCSISTKVGAQICKQGSGSSRQQLCI